MNDIIASWQNNDDKKAYALSKKIGAKSAASDEYYAYFDEFISLLNHKSSYVRTRGFCLACAQARWDEDGKLSCAMNSMFTLLHDEKPTVVRQCLGALHEVVLYKPELCGVIHVELGKIDLSKYKDSMVTCNPYVNFIAIAALTVVFLIVGTYFFTKSEKNR